eukprot:TRINITY_DN20991_c0_g1_i3.p1 TRINITY_DN20991_c0_g1~~TRINITY_DN20991_c0_g1_i3.p1  ORF type:complete len:236 (-),score=29.83 TRINITY_DN20991_c0_g1_i3:64-771(-)
MLVEDSVKLLLEAPNSLRILVHKAMFEPVLSTFAWLPNACLKNELAFSLEVCHHALTESVVGPSTYAFRPMETSAGPLVVTSGQMYYFPPESYQGRRSSFVQAEHSRKSTSSAMSDNFGRLDHDGPRIKVEGDQWLADISLWTSDWKYRGTAESSGTSHYVSIRAEVFAEFARRNGGPLFSHLSLCGLLLVSYVEENEEVTDLGIDARLRGRLLKTAAALEGMMNVRRFMSYEEL